MYYAVRDSLAWQKVCDEVVVVDLAANSLMGLSVPAGELFLAVAAKPWSWPAEGTATETWDQLVAAGLFVRRPAVATEEAGEPLPTPEGLAGGPTVVWREKLAAFAKACLFQPGNDLCNAGPAS